VPHGARLACQLAGRGIEAREIVTGLREQPREAREAVEVGGHGSQARVVQARGNPLLVQRITRALAQLERADVGRERAEDLRLAGPHLIARHTRGIQQREPGAAVRQQAHERRGVRLALAQLLQALRRALPRQPALESRVLDRGGERLVEFGIAAHVQQLVSELVEDSGGELIVAVAQHAREHRVGEPAEGRVGGHAVDGHIQTAHRQSGGELAGALLAKITPVGDAAGDRETPALRADRELRRRDHVPHHVWPADVGVTAIAAAVGESQLAGGELTRSVHLLQMRAQRRRRVRVGQQRIDGHTPAQYLPLAARGLHEIQGAAAAQQRTGRRQQQRAHAAHNRCGGIRRAERGALG